jgi:hypothetical protein
MLPRDLAISLAVLTLGGCALFSALSGQDPNQNNQGYVDPAEQERLAAEEAAKAQEQADLALAAEIDPLRTAANAETATLDQVLAFVEKVASAIQTGAIERGRVAPEVVSEARAALDRQHAAVENDKSPDATRARTSVELGRGFLLASEGRPDEASMHYFAAVTLEPTLEMFTVLAELPKSVTTDAAVLQACPLVRKAVANDRLPDFIAVCLDASGGDRSKLAWKSIKADLKAHDAEMQRREEEAARIAAEQARIAAEQEAAAAEAAAQTQLWSSAAVFASGRCRFSNCLEDGWESSTDQGTVTTTCRFQNCLKDGWETRFPDGNSATTNCRFQDCMKDGWETRMPDGSTATTSCRFQNCPVDGWETRMPDGSTATTTCRFQNCFKDGWETSLPDGGSVSCTCKFQQCLTDGSDCG